MLQLEKRTNAFNVNDQERPAANAMIQAFQEKTGVEYPDFKSLVNALLSHASQEDMPTPIDNEKYIDRDFVVVSTDSTEIAKEFLEVIPVYIERFNLEGEDATPVNILRHAINEAFKEPEKITETVEVIKQIEIASNQLLITIPLSGWKSTPQRAFDILDEIAKRRQTKYRNEELESRDLIALGLMFSGGATMNKHNDFYTGFTLFRPIKS